LVEKAGELGADYLSLGALHLACAAFLAISARLFADSFAALALPPFKPPLRPIVARYFEMGVLAGGDFFGVFAVGACSVWAGGRVESFRGFLERIMQW
jgi:hypothetical protein